MAVSGIGVAMSASGLVLMLSGVRNQTVKATLTTLLKGQLPASNPTGPPVIGVETAGGQFTPADLSSVPVTGSAISDDALRYAGHPYIYGGAPGASGAAGWDCSSFVNWVLGHDLGMTLPGASQPGYSGAEHGPTTMSYLTWTGADTVSFSVAAAAQPGDLCVWQTHMGIATGAGNMISALNEKLGTQVTTIADGAPGGEMLFVRRVKAAARVRPTRGAV